MKILGSSIMFVEELQEPRISKNREKEYNHGKIYAYLVGAAFY